MKPFRLHKSIRICLAMMLSVAILLPVFSQQAEAAAVNEVVRVGLFYGSSTLATANLANEVGSGYRFGYFDSNRNFVEVGYTVQEKITTCKDTNLYYASGTYYDTQQAVSSTLVGAYHLQVDQVYSSYDEAAAAALNYPYGFPAYINGEYRVRFEFYSTAENAAADSVNYAGVSVVGASTSCYTVVITGTNTILFEYDLGFGGNYFAIMPDITGEEDHQTWFKGYRYRGGFEYCRRTGENLTVINYVALNDYIQGVIPYEMNPSWPLETLKAGAVAARTYAEASVKHIAYGFDVCISTDCQVYRGVYSGSYAPIVALAAEETTGECIYYDGKLIEALYHAADGGATVSSAEAWGGHADYLIGKEDPFETSISVPSEDWSYSLDGNDLAAVIRAWSSSYSSCSKIVSFSVTSYTELGNVYSIEFVDSNGRTYTFTKDAARGIFQNYYTQRYFSRRFIVVAPGETYNGISTKGDETSGTFVATDGVLTEVADSVYVLSADGVELISEEVVTITSSGMIVPTVEEENSNGFETVTNTSTDEWLIVGKGYGHNVGMSQYGAYAMGLQGYTYDEILKFYYTGVTIE